MIPQRNISLLANRLAKEGGRRIPESVLERDYCLAWLLAALAESDVKPVLGFKGGTALKRCYFGDYRFSQDLYFTLTAPVTADDLKTRLETVYAAVREASGIQFGFDREDRQKHDNSYTFYLRYEGPLPRGSDVKVDITLRERLVYPLVERPILRGYKELTDLPENRCCSSTRWRKSQSRKAWRWLTGRATNRGTSTIFGISPRAKELTLARLRMGCVRNLNFAGSRAKAWPTPSAPRRPG
jgi:hypothetical protein